MSFRRVGGLAAIGLAIVLWVACGEVYRPVVIPINNIPPNPSNFHAVFGISTNAPGNPGTVMQIDVAGDSDIGVANMGVNPTHAAILPGNSRVFVANGAGDPCNGVDIITSFVPATPGIVAAGLSNFSTFTLPNVTAVQSPSSAITAISESGNVVTATLTSALANAVPGASIVISNVVASGADSLGYNGCFPITSASGTTIQYVTSITGLTAGLGGSANLPTFCPYLPDYLATSQASAMYVANYGVEGNPNCNLSSTDSIAFLEPVSNTVGNIAYLPGGSHPVAMAETPNGEFLYVVNRGNNTVSVLSTLDLSAVATISVGATPVWAVARADGQRVYVLTQGSGTLVAIDTVTNIILPSQTNLSVGAGANFVLYDPNLSRLYVTNPGIPTGSSAAVYVYSTTGGTDLTGAANDTPSLLMTIPMAANSTTCPAGCSPVSVAALPDGSRFYVASYRTQTNCADPNVGSSKACMIPTLTVFDALSMKVKPATSSSLSPQLSLLMPAQFAATQYAVPTVTSCVPPAIWAPAPGSTRFRMFAAPAADSSHVYVSICDAGVVADVSTSTSTLATGSTNGPDQLVTDVPTPFSAGPTGPNGEPATQNPVFLLTGQ